MKIATIFLGGRRRCCACRLLAAGGARRHLFPPAAATPLPHADKPLSSLPIEVEMFSAEGVYAEQALIYTVTPDAGSLRTYHYQLWSDPPTHALQTRLTDCCAIPALRRW